MEEDADTSTEGTVILILDPGSSTGYCLVSLKSDDEDGSDDDPTYIEADIYEYGFLDVDLTSEYQGDHCIDLMNKLQTIIDDYGVSHIAVEDYFFSRKCRNGSNVNAAFRTAIHILARQNDMEYTIINISAWKTFVAGRSTPTKEQKKQWGGEAAKKLYMQQALWEKYKYRFPNHSLSPKTGKPITFRFDIVDVVGQAVYYCGLVCGIPKKKITLSVDPPKDVTFKREVKKIFKYE